MEGNHKFIVPVRYTVTAYTIVEAEDIKKAREVINETLELLDEDEDLQTFDEEYSDWTVVDDDIKQIN